MLYEDFSARSTYDRHDNLFKVIPLDLGQSYDCASETSLKNMGI